MLDIVKSVSIPVTFSFPLYLVVISVTIVCFSIVLGLYKMDVARLLQAMKDGKNNIPAKFRNSTENKERFKEMHKQKDLQIKQLEARVVGLEEEISLLKAQNVKSEIQADPEKKEDLNTSEVMAMLRNYEELITKVMAENDELRMEKLVVEQHADNLQQTIQNVIHKYDYAKEVIEGLKENETLLVGRLKIFEAAFQVLENKYAGFRELVTPNGSNPEVIKKIYRPPNKILATESKLSRRYTAK